MRQGAGALGCRVTSASLQVSPIGPFQVGSNSLSPSSPTQAPETRMSGLVPPPYTRPGSCTVAMEMGSSGGYC